MFSFLIEQLHEEQERHTRCPELAQAGRTGASGCSRPRAAAHTGVHLGKPSCANRRAAGPPCTSRRAVQAACSSNLTARSWNHIAGADHVEAQALPTRGGQPDPSSTEPGCAPMTRRSRQRPSWWRTGQSLSDRHTPAPAWPGLLQAGPGHSPSLPLLDAACHHVWPPGERITQDHGLWLVPRAPA